jgi:benzodiazapine receptor
MGQYEWYLELARPVWAPPAWLFGPAWTVLYVLIAISFFSVVREFLAKRLPFSVLLPFLLNLGFNLAFTPIQFGLRNNLLAAFDVVAVLVTLIWAMVAVWKHTRWVTYINIPYLLWVMFATVLQLTVTIMNW